jgi:predicted transglutaminase-like cysteine proteinase
MCRTERRASYAPLWQRSTWLFAVAFATALPLRAQPPAAADNLVPPPPGFMSFCVRFPDQCKASSDEPTAVRLTDDRWRALQQVNARVNQSIWPEDDETHYGRPEYWNIPTDDYGDCEDYALTKRKELIGRGFPEPALRMAIVNTPSNSRHAVLVVATNKGDYVLDNLTDDIVDSHQTPYTWLEEQSANNPRQWVSLQRPGWDQTAAGSVK